MGPRIVWRRRDQPAQIARRFAARLTRALPLDEVLLQLAELTRLSTPANAVEVWVAEAGGQRPGSVLRLGAAVPSAALPDLRLTGEETEVLLSGVPRGQAWLAVWLPAVGARFEGVPVRLTPMVHQGRLLGALVVAGSPGRGGFADRDDLVLADLARQTAVALHNSHLDAALGATVDQLHRTNDELRRSRARLVATAEEERRRFERDLHDGAQQHLVSVSVKTLLARQALEAGRTTDALGLLDEVKADTAVALEELRVLAHGLFPTELAAGLGEALTAVAARAPVPVRLELGFERGTRFDPSVEACCYFCCAEAVANVAKHAGPAAHAVVSVRRDGDALVLEVTDDGYGFDAAGPGAPVAGHGLQNMIDRAGVLGGQVVVGPASPQGTNVRVRIPLTVPTADTR